MNQYILKRVFLMIPTVVGAGALVFFLMATMPAWGSDAVKPGDSFWDCAACPEMVVVPAGVFAMGASFAEGGDDEWPIHRVRIPRPLAIGRHEVKRGEFKAFVEETGYELNGPCQTLAEISWGEYRWREDRLASYRNSWFPQTDDHPVVCVNWYDAKAYTAWLSKTTGKTYRLPSEAEWEYAARAGATALYHFGTAQQNICLYGNGVDASSPFKWRNEKCNDGYGRGTAPVGSFRPNAFGLHDTTGNVWEWVEDCWNDSYKGAPVDGTPWTTGRCWRRSVRGGSWLNDPRFLRSATRFSTFASYRKNNHGFRVARPLAE